MHSLVVSPLAKAIGYSMVIIFKGLGRHGLAYYDVSHIHDA